MPNKKNLVLVQQNRGLSLAQKVGVLTILSISSVSTFAADGITLPEISVTQFVTYIGLLVAAVATVASANLMIPMVAKGIKAIKLAF